MHKAYSYLAENSCKKTRLCDRTLQLNPYLYFCNGDLSNHYSRGDAVDITQAAKTQEVAIAFRAKSVRSILIILTFT
ncbi:MAG: hypothetical protein V7K26_00215 [Nostoc sp.]|uniref:hypothetical protein n=1 Tax=Nostoc sp. TaxID=1180 RepID=UPI002FEFC98B